MVGWIKLHRKFLEWEHYGNRNVKDLFLHLLLSAAHDDIEVGGITVKRGQVLTTVRQLAKDLGMTIQQVRTAMKKLQATGEIKVQVTELLTELLTEPLTEVITEQVTERITGKRSVVTICNFGCYQDVKKGHQQSHQQSLQQSLQQSHQQSLQQSNQQIINKKILKKKNKKEKSITNVIDTKKEKKTDAAAVMTFFNRSMEGRRIPCIKSVANMRLEMLQARIAEHGIDAVYEAITNAAASSFLNGRNDRGFIATFDWIVRPNNFPKVLEGNYSDRDEDDRRDNQGGEDPLAYATVHRVRVG